MNKTELVNVVATETGLTKTDAGKAVNAVLEAITETLSEGGKVQLVGFGTFETRDRAARVGRSPKTGEEIQIPAKKAPAFKAGKALKEAVSGK
ncbi:HU family DNA-binding protein [Priestia megaterium]